MQILKTKSGRKVLTAPRMDGENISPAKRRRQWREAFAAADEEVRFSEKSRERKR